MVWSQGLRGVGDVAADLQADVAQRGNLGGTLRQPAAPQSAMAIRAPARA